MYNIILFILTSCFLFAETKIGYIDSGVILSQYEDVRQVQVTLEKEQKKLIQKNYNQIMSQKFYHWIV